MTRNKEINALEALGLEREQLEGLAALWNQNQLPADTAGALLSSLSVYSGKELTTKVVERDDGQRVEVHAFDQFGVCSECAMKTDRFYWYDIGDGHISNPLCKGCYAHQKGKPFGSYNRVVVYMLDLDPTVFAALAVWYSFHEEAVRGDPLLTQSTGTLINQLGADDEFPDLF
jgi:hypothetical protein